MSKEAIDKVILFANMHKTRPCWRLYYGHDAKNGNLASTSESFHAENGQLTHKTSIEALEKLLPLLPSGDYKIGFKEEEQKSDNVYYTFRLSNQADPGINGNGSFPVRQQQPILPNNMVTIETMNQIMDARIGKMQSEFEKNQLQRDLAELRKENEKLSRKKNSDWSGLIELGKVVVPQIMAKLNGTPGPQVAIMGNGGFKVPADAAKQSTMVNDQGAESESEVELSPEEQQAYQKKWLDFHGNNIKLVFESQGSNEKGIILIFLLRRWMEENPDMFKTIVLPQLEPFKKELANYGLEADQE